ncbi:hypothetical protein EVAR_32795_1 [Eumeta japonica]|uniref:Uncharacterized protein n=1 Tax=Eumeta variegata TaxID=151549 RepID=A0A4C1WE77_EUMVA|nr:hypothetical protein EVAR_32795_1 [Eumeta japonica]
MAAISYPFFEKYVAVLFSRLTLILHFLNRSPKSVNRCFKMGRMNGGRQRYSFYAAITDTQPAREMQKESERRNREQRGANSAILHFDKNI